MTLAELGETIRLRRKELHMTQRDLAEKADIDYQTVSTLENGYKGPRWDTLMMVTEVLGLEVKVERKDD
jgi:transcriptional regulator with XRE-family HTH domain